eukprot:4778904-Pyramimonas_sp.AAC.1
MRIALYQLERGRHFAFEHPLFASSWTTKVVQLVAQLPGVRRARIDVCMFGLRVTKDGLNKKPTGLLTNHPRLSEIMD